MDDGRGSCVVFRCVGVVEGAAFARWRAVLDAQVGDRSESLWVRPRVALGEGGAGRRVLIVDIGTASVRAGLFGSERKLKVFFCLSLNRSMYAVPGFLEN